MAITRSKQDTKKSEQVVLNDSYDEDFNMLAVELVGYDSDANVLRRVKVNSAGAVQLDTTSLDSRYVNVTGDTMTGDLVFSGSQKIIGGTGTTSDLTLQTTSGVGASGADMHFLVGNNGATEAMTILNSGAVGIGQTPIDGISLTVGEGLLIQGTAGVNSGNADFALLTADTTGYWSFSTSNSTGEFSFFDALTSTFPFKLEKAAPTNALVMKATTGRIGLGTTSPASRLDVSEITGGILTLTRVDTTVTANDMVGKIQFYADDASTTTNFIVADIEAQATNTISTNINPGRLIFRTTSTTVGASPTEAMRIDETQSVIINDTGLATADFRIESDTDTEVFFVDASANRVGISTTAPGASLDIGGISAALDTSIDVVGLGIGGTGNIKIGVENTIASGSGAGAGFAAYSNDGAAMANGDRLGFMLFGGSKSASATNNSAGFFSFATEAWVDGSAYGADLRFETTPNGGTSRVAGVVVTNPGGLTVNETGHASGDMRVEGDTDTNLLFTDALADTVQVGAATASDSAKFYVAGKISTSGEMEINGDLNHDGTNIGFFATAPVAQQTGIADADGTLADITTKFNSLLTKLEAYGLLTTV